MSPEAALYIALGSGHAPAQRIGSYSVIEGEPLQQRLSRALRDCLDRARSAGMHGLLMCWLPEGRSCVVHVCEDDLVLYVPIPSLDIREERNAQWFMERFIDQLGFQASRDELLSQYEVNLARDPERAAEAIMGFSSEVYNVGSHQSLWLLGMHEIGGIYSR